MKDKYEILLTLKVKEYEMNELLGFAKECPDCFELLKKKLDELPAFIQNGKYEKQWEACKKDEEVIKYTNRLRKASVQAVCDIEKYHSSHAGVSNISSYISQLSGSVMKEMTAFGINRDSKVLIIGSGAFPVTTLTIAKETGSEVVGVDIDQEAVRMAREIALTAGVQAEFTSEKLALLPFLKKATHIVIASLVEDKKGVLKDLYQHAKSNVKILLRYGNGLKSVFNYPYMPSGSKEWIQTLINEDEPGFYDTILIEKAGCHQSSGSSERTYTYE
ncbi:class I SAM-dependent methyltransferase [Metabacillus sp. FJAT-52054]|uniref:Class I SAM-dependent methyltransferase n=1 Tax=Metabacillus sediminis TaxID=3117746 RepID=A0ABZ2NF45_9BACI